MRFCYGQVIFQQLRSDVVDCYYFSLKLCMSKVMAAYVKATEGTYNFILFVWRPRCWMLHGIFVHWSVIRCSCGCNFSWNGLVKYELKLELQLHWISVSFMLSDMSPAGHFLVWCVGAKLFTEYLSHCHKANEYIAALLWWRSRLPLTRAVQWRIGLLRTLCKMLRLII